MSNKNREEPRSREGVRRERYLRDLDNLEEKMDKFEDSLDNFSNCMVKMKKEMVKIRSTLETNREKWKQVREDIQEIKNEKIDNRVDERLELHKAKCEKTDITEEDIKYNNGMKKKILKFPKEHPTSTAGGVAATLYALIELIRSLL